MTIETQADFSTRPVHGTFEVTDGADVLGCSSGTFVDEFLFENNINKVMTCDSGSNEGTFTVLFVITSDSGLTEDNGPWTAVEGSGDFVGLQGGGDFSVVYSTDEPLGVETLTGDIKYTS